MWVPHRELIGVLISVPLFWVRRSSSIKLSMWKMSIYLGHGRSLVIFVGVRHQVWRWGFVMLRGVELCEKEGGHAMRAGFVWVYKAWLVQFEAHLIQHLATTSWLSGINS